MRVSNTTKRIKEIRRKTRVKFSSEEQIRIVLSSEGAQVMSPLINRATFDRISNQRDILRHIIQIYLEITPDTLEEINAGVAGGDSEQVGLAAHSLKGSSAELGAEQLAELCQQLCMVAKAENRESAELLATEVSYCYRETSTAMGALDLG
jgi:HPt (histidine-containing phosphotransfer) domain-containing protein